MNPAIKYQNATLQIARGRANNIRIQIDLENFEILLVNEFPLQQL